MRCRLSLLLVILASIALPNPGSAMERITKSRVAENYVAPLTGESRLSIPIPVPVGTGGFAPALEVRYSSGDGEGFFGLGWSLPLGEVRRSTRFGAPRFDTSDRFELNDALLVYDAASNSYRTETESFVRLQQVGDTWVAEFPDGMVARYGADEESRIRRDADLTPDSGDGPIARWLLTELEDVHGTGIKFFYDRTTDRGTAYPASISYNYRDGALVGGAAHERQIVFVTEVRPDPVISAKSGVYAEMHRRIAEVYSVADDLDHRRTVFEYTNVGHSNDRTRLFKVRTFGSDCAAGADVSTCETPATRLFGYFGDEIYDVLPPLAPTLPYHFTGPYVPNLQIATLSGLPAFVDAAGNDLGVRIGDVDGDRVPDFLQAHDTLGHGVQLGTTGLAPDWSDRLAEVSFAAWDVDAAACDYVAVPSQALYFAQSHDFTTQAGTPPQEAQLTDLDGDGLADLLVSYQVGPLYCDGANPALKPAKQVLHAFRNTGDPATGWVEDATLAQGLAGVFVASGIEHDCGATAPPATEQQGEIDSCTWGYVFPQGTTLVDLNGDGLKDVASRGAPAHPSALAATGADLDANVPEGAWLVTRTGWVAAPEYTPPYPMRKTASGVVADTGLRITDLNGDGLADAVKTGITIAHITDAIGDATFAASGVWFNDGSGWCDETACPEASRYAPLPGYGFIRESDSSGSTSAAPPWAAEQWFVETIPDFRFVDLSGNGLPDHVSGGSWEVQDTADFDGDGTVWGTDPQTTGPVPNTLIGVSGKVCTEGVHSRLCDAGVRLLDFNRDGRTDVIQGTTAYLSENPFSDLLRFHDTGQGGQIRFAYENFNSYAEVSSGFDQAFTIPPETLPPEIVPALPEKPVTWIVAVLTSNPGDPGEGEALGTPTDFAYAEPRLDLERRELSFAAIDGGRHRPIRAFSQQPGLRGRLRLAQQKPHAYDGTNLGVRTIWDWEAVDGSTVTGSVAGALVPRITGITHELYDENGKTSLPRTVAYTYDDSAGFNFREQITTARPSGTLLLDRTPETFLPGLWRAPASATEIATDDGGIVLSSRAFAYDEESPGYPNPKSVTRTVQARVANPATTTNAETSYVYDDYGNITQIADPEGRIRSFCYDGGCSGSSGAYRFVVIATDALGETERFWRNRATGQVVHILHHQGDQSHIEVDAFGRVLESSFRPVTTGIHTILETRTYGYEGQFNRTWMERQLEIGDGTTTPVRTSFDALGVPITTEIENPQGSLITVDGTQYSEGDLWDYDRTDSTWYSFDNNGFLTQVMSEEEHHGIEHTLIDIAPDAGTGMPPGTYHLVSDIDRNADTITQRVMDGDRVLWVWECQNHPVDPSTHTCTDPDETFYAYEPTGEIRAIYDAVTVANDDYTDPSHRLRYTYDTLGRTLTIEDPDGGTSQTGYDLVGNVTSVTNARGQETLYTYDALDRLINLDLPDSTVDTVITYDPRTRKRESVNQNNVYGIEYEYDDFHRLSEKRLLAGPLLIMDFEYDLLGRPTKITYPSDALYSRASYVYQGLWLEKVCGLLNPANCAANPPNYHLSNIDYDSFGRPTQIDEPGGGVRRFGYAPGNRFDFIEFQNAAQEKVVRLDYEWYAGDPSLPDFGKLITKITDTHEGVGAVGTDPMNATENFTYDARGRLASDDLQGTPVYFGYDALGNLTHRSVASPPTAQNANQHYDDPARPHALTLADHSGKAYTYGDDGNVLTRGGQNVVYDSQNRLVCVGVTGDPCSETQLSYTLDGVLYRVKENGEFKFLMGDWFDWDQRYETATSHIFALGQEVVTAKSTNAVLRTQGWLPADLLFNPRPWGLGAGILGLAGLLAWLARLGVLAQLRLRPAASGAAVFLAVLLVPPPGWTGGGPPSFGDGGNNFLRRWIQRDHLGTAIAYTAYDGSLVERRVFEPFGEVVATEMGTEATTQSFTGQPLEDAVDAYNFDARWYDSETGRFASIDPVVQSVRDPQSHNAYTYVRNDPLLYTDPTGAIWSNTQSLPAGFYWHKVNSEYFELRSTYAGAGADQLSHVTNSGGGPAGQFVNEIQLAQYANPTDDDDGSLEDFFKYAPILGPLIWYMSQSGDDSKREEGDGGERVWTVDPDTGELGQKDPTAGTQAETLQRDLSQKVPAGPPGQGPSGEEPPKTFRQKVIRIIKDAIEFWNSGPGGPGW